MTDRRQVLKGTLGGLLSLTLPPFVWARQSPGILRLNEKLSLITDVETNVLALSGGEGLVLVDSGGPDFSDRLMSHLGRLTASGRVQRIFNTHYHLENTGSNKTFGEAGAKIVAHENTRLWMATDYWVPAQERYEKARPAAAHPTETFYANGSIEAGGERIDYGYLVEAHTNGDIYVFFRDSNVLAAGDVASPARDPELDYFTGAWIGGRVDAMDRLLKLSNDETRIVPGYGPVINRAQLKAERDMMAAVLDRTFERVREGDSARDMLDAGVLKGLPWTWKDPYKFLYDVHKGLWAHHNKLAPNVV
jgi:glyoxylase-like metal-dependent hydrolase (beta-lactamase superfamily II)